MLAAYSFLVRKCGVQYQVIAFIGGAIAHTAFFVWVVCLVRR